MSGSAVSGFDLLVASLPLLGNGVLVTLQLTVLAALVATAVGLAIAFVQLFGGLLLCLVAEAYLYIARGVPLLVLLFGDVLRAALCTASWSSR